ncbi:probable membrane-associated kinase regulator 4 [Mangifera indica]|uniref:probable membrane-associated kinase regulator 4 n=1 Tax=Mangifera indica TaxID=29780 RepID=UPI001CFB7542|nr:probable membrane-associated kinase regulator 4 [Mangifera indica]
MAVNLLSYDNADDDYIDMEVSSYSNFFSKTMATNSPPHPREFEFQMSSTCLEREPSTSPADELFYKGKLLPLHLPPRLQMVEKLLENTNCVYGNSKGAFDQDFYSTPLATTLTTPTAASTPFESCNISPSESCQVSRELNPNEYFFEYTTDEVSGLIGENQKKSWTKKLKLIKQAAIGSKLRASRAYFKSLFGKSGCSDESCTAATKVSSEGQVSKAKECLNNHVNAAKKNPFGQIRKCKYQISGGLVRSFDKGEITEESANCHRRSFSMVIKRHSTKKSSSSSSSSGSSSSSSSNDSNGFHELQFLKRSSSSAYSEFENSIQGAIAHCKQSQQLFHSRKALSEVGFHSFSTSRITVCDDQDRPDLCRG